MSPVFVRYCSKSKINKHLQLVEQKLKIVIYKNVYLKYVREVAGSLRAPEAPIDIGANAKKAPNPKEINLIPCTRGNFTLTAPVGKRITKMIRINEASINL